MRLGCREGLGKDESEQVGRVQGCSPEEVKARLVSDGELHADVNNLGDGKC